MCKKIGFIVFLLFLFQMSVFAIEPINIESFNKDVQEFIIKTFELPPDAEIEPLIEQEFIKDSYKFIYQSTEKEEILSEYTIDYSFETEQKTNTNDTKAILKKFESYIDCDEDGFIGKAYIDPSSLETKVAGYANKSYTISDTREYGGFRYNDPSGIPRAVEKDGHTLTMQGVNWTVLGTELIGDSLVPNSYKATVSYSTTATKSVPTGYISTVRYNATLSKTVVDKVVYKITYQGELLPRDNKMALYILYACGLLVLLGCAFVIMKILKKDVEIYNLQNNEYVLIDRDWIDMKNPVIDLLPLKEASKSDSYAFILSKKAVKELLGKSITITMENMSVTKKVENDKIYLNGTDEA